MMSDFNLLEMAEPFESWKDRFTHKPKEYHRCRWCGKAIAEGLQIKNRLYDVDYFCNEDCLTAWDKNQAKKYGAREADDANRTDG